MVWKGWEDYVPQTRAGMVSSTRKTPMISAARAENINDSALAPQASSTPQTRSKYGVRTDAQGKLERTRDGILFASKREMKRYGELKLLEKAGEIWDLELQPKFPLLVPSTSGQTMRALKAIAQGGSVRLGEYRGDFLYWDKSGKVVEDSKGWDTALSRWKRRHVLAQYGIKVRIV